MRAGRMQHRLPLLRNRRIMAFPGVAAAALGVAAAVLGVVVLGVAGLGVAGLIWAQGPGGAAPVPPNAATDPLLRGFEFRSIGPATMMGRVDDIAGAEKDPLLLYVGFATGGLWKSADGGNHWKAMFDEHANNSIGAIVVAPSDPNIVYVGKGEANNRQS